MYELPGYYRCFIGELLGGGIMDIGYLIAGLDLVIGIVVVILSIISTVRLKGGLLAWVSKAFMILALLFVTHAGIEIFGFGKELYAISALVATLVLAFCMVIIDIATEQLGVKNNGK